MSLQVIEGTWEEIERRKAELVGHRLRVTVKPQRPTAPLKKSVPTQKLAVAGAKSTERPSALGKYAFVAASSDDFAREKQAEIEREDNAHG